MFRKSAVMARIRSSRSRNRKRIPARTPPDSSVASTGGRFGTSATRIRNEMK